MNRAARWRLLSDLHLGVSDDDPRRPGKMLPEFLHHEVLEASGPQQHVVFVGDTFELAGLVEDESLARLESILARHRETFQTLRACAARGVQLHFVCGNHDVELARPSVAARLSSLLSPVEPGQVQVHPWFLHVPHVLVAEHGHQHHALHRIPELLRTAVSGTDELDLPPLAAWHAQPSSSRLSRAGAVARACLASERAERRARELAYGELLQAESLRLELDAAAVRDLARLSRFRTVSALPRTATRMVLAAAGRSIASEEAPAAAGRVARTLEAHGSRVAWYVSGHTHRALESALEGCPTRYVNTGTWCSDVRGRGPDQSDRRAFPYAVVDVARDGTTSGGLRYWRPDVGGTIPVSRTGRGGLHARVQGMVRRAAGHMGNPTCARAWRTSAPCGPGNGKVERFNRTLTTEWAYARPYTSEAERAATYPDWLHQYNHCES